MKALIVLALFLPSVPADRYPMRANIVSAVTNTWTGKLVEQGYGNLSFGRNHPPIAGFEFVAENCPGRFRPSVGPSSYAARLDDDQHILIMAMSQIGSDEVVECKMKITVRPFIFDTDGSGKLITHPLPN